MTAAQRKELQRLRDTVPAEEKSRLVIENVFTERLAKLSIVEQRALAVIKERERRAAEAAEAARLRLEEERRVNEAKRVAFLASFNFKKKGTTQ